MKIRFLQVAIAQWEHNNKLKGTFHCTIGINLDTYELTRMYPVEMYKMQKHGVYEVEVDSMTCRRENSFKPLKIKQVDLFKKEQTQIILNQIRLTSINELNENHLSMGIVDITSKIIKVETTENYINDSQFDLFEGTEFSKKESLKGKSYSNKLYKDIRVIFPTRETKQGYRDLSYNEHHFFVGLEKNGTLPKYYNDISYDRMIVGNLRNHRSTFIGLCMFKSGDKNLFS
jgi:hypothetical protein